MSTISKKAKKSNNNISIRGIISWIKAIIRRDPKNDNPRSISQKNDYYACEAYERNRIREIAKKKIDRARNQPIRIW